MCVFLLCWGLLSLRSVALLTSGRGSWQPTQRSALSLRMVSLHGAFMCIQKWYSMYFTCKYHTNTKVQTYKNLGSVPTCGFGVRRRVTIICCIFVFLYFCISGFLDFVLGPLNSRRRLSCLWAQAFGACRPKGCVRPQRASAPWF